MAETSKYTEAKKKGNRKWDAANLDRLSVAAPKGTKARWKAAADRQGKSLNQFIVDTVDAGMCNPRSAPERPEGGGGIQLPTKALQTAQSAAEATGEDLTQFLERAVLDEAERDKRSWKMGINPATREKAGE